MKNEKEVTIKKILVGTDFSPCSDRAIDYAFSIAAQFGGEILLLHVIESFSYSVTDSLTIVGHEKALKVTAGALMENLEKQLSERGRIIQRHISHGTPYREIINTAKKEACDLIVVGTHGHSAMEHLLLGSVAEKVVRLSDCPVLTVRS